MTNANNKKCLTGVTLRQRLIAAGLIKPGPGYYQPAWLIAAKILKLDIKGFMAAAYGGWHPADHIPGLQVTPRHLRWDYIAPAFTPAPPAAQ